jgi:D-alanine-D-alanine ligase
MKIDVKPDWWKTLFDDVYLMTDARSVCDEEITRREVDAVCSLLTMAKTDAILDLCGGQGRHSLELTARGAGNCTVVDYSTHLVEVGRETAVERGLNVDFRQGDVRETGLPGSSFDHVIIMGNSMGYLPEDDDDLRILREAHRLLKKGSWILVDVADGEKVRSGLDPNAWHEIDEDLVVCRHRELDNGRVKAREMVFSRQDGLLRDQTYSIRVFEPDTLVTTLSTAGFSDVKVHRDFSPHQKEGDYGFMNRRMLGVGKKPD